MNDNKFLSPSNGKYNAAYQINFKKSPNKFAVYQPNQSQKEAPYKANSYNSYNS